MAPAVLWMAAGNRRCARPPPEAGRGADIETKDPLIR